MLVYCSAISTSRHLACTSTSGVVLLCRRWLIFPWHAPSVLSSIAYQLSTVELCPYFTFSYACLQYQHISPSPHFFNRVTGVKCGCRWCSQRFCQAVVGDVLRDFVKYVKHEAYYRVCMQTSVMVALQSMPIVPYLGFPFTKFSHLTSATHASWARA